MQLQVIIEDRARSVTVPEYVANEGEEFFAKMDADMDGGWQMSRTWVEKPNQVQRCQIAADRLVAALEVGDEPMKMLMAGYIVSRLPGVTAVRVDNEGDMMGTEFVGAQSVQ
ncbi:hypothetical protein [Thiohalomonas denitrificans]|uniref:Uncharacterized protein n=1 Tax=Thiohalomonas denitrificans TaxID=415747 RepID=A0A1G5QHR4_9GAMM|nr:hypothetical protein [Thiohalomonas denitrificans]SCZ61126.1 hypothetical protein SAMN03097708_02087 [Thiohalomonas denitrificans]